MWGKVLWSLSFINSLVLLLSYCFSPVRFSLLAPRSLLRCCRCPMSSDLLELRARAQNLLAQLFQARNDNVTTQLNERPAPALPMPMTQRAADRVTEPVPMLMPGIMSGMAFGKGIGLDNDAFFESMRLFRQTHRQQCQGANLEDSEQWPAGLSCGASGRTARAVLRSTQPAFHVGERLQLKETKTHSSGYPLLPGDPKQFVRVSVPAGTFSSHQGGASRDAPSKNSMTTSARSSVSLQSRHTVRYDYADGVHR